MIGNKATDWLGELPKDWNITTIGNIFLNRDVKVNENDYQPLSVTMGGIVPQLDTAVKTSNKENRKLIKEGDFVINGRSDRRGAYGIAPMDGCCSVINLVLEPRNHEEARYYEYVLHSETFPEEFYRWGNGIVSDLWTTKWDSMKRIVLPNPPAEIRHKIVNYLDHKCEKVNSVIRNEEQLITKLEELRASLITEYVSGKHNNTKFKPSGFPWLELIPEDWTMVYSKRLFEQRKEKARPDDVQLTASQKYGVISQEKFMELEGRQVVQVVLGEDILKHVEKGDFVISMRSFQGGLEYSNVTGKISSAYVMLRPRTQDIYPGYYKWLFKSQKYIKALQSTTNLVRDGQALRYSNFAQIYLPLFSKEKQKAIADELDKKCDEIDRAIGSSESIIKYLKDYKRALIFEVTTGKRKVM